MGVHGVGVIVKTETGRQDRVSGRLGAGSGRFGYRSGEGVDAFAEGVAGDSREALLTFVPGLVAQTVGTTHRLLGQGTLPRHIPQLVLKGVQGLESLRHTYAHDARFLARFDASLSSVRELDAVLGINTSLYLAL